MLVQPERRALGHGIVFSLSFTLQPNLIIMMMLSYVRALDEETRAHDRRKPFRGSHATTLCCTSPTDESRGAGAPSRKEPEPDQSAEV